MQVLVVQADSEVSINYEHIGDTIVSVSVNSEYRGTSNLNGRIGGEIVAKRNREYGTRT